MTASNRFEAQFYDRAGWDNVTCRLCPHQCSIAPSRSGACGVRSNRGGTLYLDDYGRLADRHIVNSDDLPLYHYKPDAGWMLLGGRGCTMRCPFCNTWKHSQAGGAMTQPVTAPDVIADARKRDCRGIAFGVNEPAHLHEFVVHLFGESRAAGLDTHLATSGMWNPVAFREALAFTSAVTIGLKGFNSELYRTGLGGDLSTVKENIEFASMGSHLELSYLVIPGVTDTAEQAADFLAFARQMHLSVPLILLPYEPHFQWKDPSRPGAAKLAEVAAFHDLLRRYAGPIYQAHPDSAENNTRCQKCGRTLIRRGMARAVITSFPQTGKPKGACPTCGTAVPYVID